MNDKTIESNGISLVYNPGIEEQLSNLMIDYEDSLLQHGFVIKGSDISSC
jgi:Fe-S cluster assembly iron-binding protein IscA